MARLTKVSIVLESIADLKGLKAFNAELNRVQAATRKLGPALDVAKGVMSGMAIAGGLAAGAVTAAATAAIKYATGLQDLAEQTGVSTHALQVLGHTAQQNGSDLDTMGKALIQVAKVAAEAAAGNEQAAEKFIRLGINASAFARLRPEQQMERLGRAVANAADQQEALAAVMEITGAKNAPRLMESLRKLGTEGFDRMAENASAAGAVMSKETIRALNEADDRIQAFTTRLTILGGEYLRLAQIAFTGGDKLVQASDRLAETEKFQPKNIRAIADARMDYIDALLAEGKAEQALIEIKRVQIRAPDRFANRDQIQQFEADIRRRRELMLAIEKAQAEEAARIVAQGEQAKTDAIEAEEARRIASFKRAAEAEAKLYKENAARMAKIAEADEKRRMQREEKERDKIEQDAKDFAAKLDAIENRDRNEYQRRGLQLGRAQDLGMAPEFRRPEPLQLIPPTPAMLAPNNAGREDQRVPALLNSIDATLKLISRKEVALA